MKKTKRQPFAVWVVVGREDRAPVTMQDEAEARSFVGKWDRDFSQEAPHRALLMREVVKPKRRKP